MEKRDRAVILRTAFTSLGVQRDQLRNLGRDLSFGLSSVEIDKVEGAIANLTDARVALIEIAGLLDIDIANVGIGGVIKPPAGADPGLPVTGGEGDSGPVEKSTSKPEEKAKAVIL